MAESSLSRSRAQVLCLGVCVLDYTVLVDEYPQPDSKQVARDMRVSSGGNAPNTASALAKLQLPVAIVSKVGADAAGQQIRDELAGFGIDCTHVRGGHAGELTPTAFVTVAGNTRTIISMPHALRVPDLRAEDFPAELFERPTALLHLDGRHPAAARRAAELARSRGVSVLVEAEVRSGGGQTAEQLRKQQEALLELADYVVTSEHYTSTVLPPDEGRSIEASLRAFLAQLAPNARCATVTLGAQGSVAVYGDPAAGWPKSLREPARALSHEELIDSTGAGDAFMAGFIYGIVTAGDDGEAAIPRALHLGSFVGACCCRGLGAKGGLPTLEQMQAVEETIAK